MTTTYRTVVVHLSPTPLGLLPERWTIEHWCSLCRQRVTPAQLVAHAQDHEQAAHAGCHESFPSPATSGTLAPDQPDPTEDRMTPGVPNASTPTTDQPRR